MAANIDSKKTKPGFFGKNGSCRNETPDSVHRVVSRHKKSLQDPLETCPIPKKSVFFPKKKCIFTDNAHQPNSKDSETLELYKCLRSEIELHEKWIDNFQSSRENVVESIFEMFKKLITENLDFDMKVYLLDHKKRINPDHTLDTRVRPEHFRFYPEKLLQCHAYI